jgi:hypothetical protein
LIIFNKKTKKEQDNPSLFLNCFTESFQELAKGVDIGEYRLFAYTSAVLGDLPGRCELCGLKIATFAQKCCYVCEILNEQMIPSFSAPNYEERPLRHESSMRSANLSVGKRPVRKDKVQELIGIKHGMAHTTELINFPGFTFTKSITMDYMHGGTQGIDQTHFILFMRCMVSYHPEIWTTVNEEVNRLLRENGIKQISKFASEKSYFKRNSHDKMVLFKYCTIALERIGVPVNLVDRFNLLKIHSKVSRILTKPSISKDEVQFCYQKLFDIRRKGLQFYGEGNDLLHPKSWITINTHYLQHVDVFIDRFGPLKATWVYSFESLLGYFKRYLDRHSNGKSEGISMLQFFWTRVACEVGSCSIKKPKYNPLKDLIRGSIVQLRNSTYGKVINEMDVNGRVTLKTVVANNNVIDPTELGDPFSLPAYQNVSKWFVMDGNVIIDTRYDSTWIL